MRPRPPVLLLLLSVLPVVALPACDGGGAHAFERERAERLARDLERARSALARAPDAGSLELFRAAVHAAWEREGEAPYMAVDDGWLRTGLLHAYLAWNEPAADSASGLPFALDTDRAGHPLTTIRRYAQVLGDAGIDLLLVPIPSRLQVHPELIADVPGPVAGFDPGHLGFTRALSESGVEVLDLLPVFSAARGEGQLFLRYDHHWSPRGIDLAAEELARRLGEYSWFERGGAREGVDFEVRTERIEFTPELPPMELSPEPQELTLHRVELADGTPAPVRDKGSPILLLGDSHLDFLEEEAADLVSLLYARTGLALDVIALPAGATDQVWRAVARRGDGLANKRIVVWLFSSARLATGRWPFIDPFRQ